MRYFSVKRAMMMRVAGQRAVRKDGVAASSPVLTLTLDAEATVAPVMCCLAAGTNRDQSALAVVRSIGSARRRVGGQSEGTASPQKRSTFRSARLKCMEIVVVCDSRMWGFCHFPEVNSDFGIGSK